MKERRVLVVDDSANNQFLINAYLRSEGYRIELAEDGAECVRQVQSNEYDVVLMDVQMPVMDGYTATREIRTWETRTGRPPIPVVALTANTLKGEEARSLEAGCSGYLSKPVSKARLLAELARHLQTPNVNQQGEQVVALPPEIRARAPVYLAGRKQDIAAIQNLLEDQLWDQIGSLAHNMKGSGSSYGFPEITRIGGELEHAAKSQDSERISEHLASLESLLNGAAPVVPDPA